MTVYGAPAVLALHVLEAGQDLRGAAEAAAQTCRAHHLSYILYWIVYCIVFCRKLYHISCHILYHHELHIILLLHCIRYRLVCYSL